MSFTWFGRQMESATANGKSITYKYNADGLRTEKTVGSTVHKYEYTGDKLFYEKRGDLEFHYRYDVFGNVASITRVKADGSNFSLYTVCNSRGDVEELRRSTGELFARYVYDTWGNVLHIYDVNGAEITSSANFAVQNPFRYRGYYYDTETGFYYVSSRYYDPTVGRFINADSILPGVGGNALGYNLYAYCMNNPVNYYDPFGMSCICLTQRVHPRHKCSSNIEDTATIIAPIDPSVPPDHPDYTPPKKWDGKKTKNPNGSGKGWPAKDGGVWVPTPNMHGGEGWTVQYPGGDHSHAYPGGKVRNHFQREQPIGQSVIMIFAGAVVTIGLLADDITGFGAADNPLLAGSTACFVGGINGVFGKQVCTECGVVRYGY